MTFSVHEKSCTFIILFHFPLTMRIMAENFCLSNTLKIENSSATRNQNYDGTFSVIQHFHLPQSVFTWQNYQIKTHDVVIIAFERNFNENLIDSSVGWFQFILDSFKDLLRPLEVSISGDIRIHFVNYIIILDSVSVELKILFGFSRNINLAIGKWMHEFHSFDHIRNTNCVSSVPLKNLKWNSH